NLQVAVLEIRRKGCESIQDDARRAPKQKWTQLKAPSYCLCLQALVYDVLNIATSSFTKLLANKEEDEDAIRENTFQYEIVNNLGKHEKKRAELGEQDELWVRFRHQHIQSVNQEVQEEIKRFVKENATAQIQKQEGQGPTLQAIRSLPQYQEMLAKYWVHASLTEQSFAQLQERNLMNVGILEQDLACGVDKDGKEVSASKLLTMLSNHLSDANAEVDDKLRLLLLYFTQMTGLSPSDRTKLMEAAQLSLTSEETVQKFLSLQLHQENVDTEAGTSRLAHRLERDKDRRKFFKRRAKNAAYELSRFEPFVKTLMERALLGDLHGGNYPFVEETRPGPKSQSRLASATEQTIGRATEWAWSSAGNQCSTTSSPVRSERPRKKFILFVLGGITHAEMRCAYEVSNELGADVILGGTSILTPPQIIRILKQSPFSAA
ncbi:Sec1 family protein, partial [Toxoplasma gondii p89]